MASMNSFARPEEAMPYEYTEFPKVEVQEESAVIPDDPNGTFMNFETAQNAPQETTQTVVQTAIFQDFKEAIAAAAAHQE